MVHIRFVHYILIIKCCVAKLSSGQGRLGRHLTTPPVPPSLIKNKGYTYSICVLLMFVLCVGLLQTENPSRSLNNSVLHQYIGVWMPLCSQLLLKHLRKCPNLWYWGHSITFGNVKEIKPFTSQRSFSKLVCCGIFLLLSMPPACCKFSLIYPLSDQYRSISHPLGFGHLSYVEKIYSTQISAWKTRPLIFLWFCIVKLSMTWWHHMIHLIFWMGSLSHTELVAISVVCKSPLL